MDPEDYVLPVPLFLLEVQEEKILPQMDKDGVEGKLEGKFV